MPCKTVLPNETWIASGARDVSELAHARRPRHFGGAIVKGGGSFLSNPAPVVN
jgi:hypothetical protein